MRKIITLLFVIGMLTGGSLNSCKRYPVDPPDTTHKCDTCCDTCHTDTTKHPCDTCNIDKDSAAHAFVWTEYTIPSETDISGVWVFGPNDIILNGGTLWHFDGAKFEKLSPIRNGSNTTLNGGLSGFSIFALSLTDYWLVYTSVAFHTSDGQYFDDHRFGPVNACWGTSSTDMFFVGNAGQITHWNGAKFDTMNLGTIKDVRKVWGTSHNDVWAGGLNRSTGQSVLLHYDGINWSTIDLSTLGKFECANCDGVSSVWAIDSSSHHKAYVGGSYFYHKTDNSIWSNDSEKVGNKLGGGGHAGLTTIRGNNASDIMCVSDWGFCSHWNGKTWKRYDEIYEPGNSSFLTNGMSFKDNTVCIVGYKNGQSWMAVGRRK